MKSKIILTLIASGLVMAPILKAEPPVVVTPGTTTTTTTTVEGSGVWTTVPEDYDGQTYIIDNHYYHGGKYESGDYTYEGHHYTDRYMHDGKWMYGGKWEHHARKAAEHAAKAEREREK